MPYLGWEPPLQFPRLLGQSRDIKFYEDFDPIKKGYIPYVLTSKVEGFKIVPGNYKIAK
jgi:hypothetical protein